MLHHRQQLDVREAHLLHVRHQAVRQLAVGQEAVALFRHPRPRSEMHFVGGHRAIEPGIAAGARRDPAGVAPFVRGAVVHDRRRLRRRLERARERIGLFQNGAGARPDLELVLLAVGQIRDEDFPDPARHEHAHRVDTAVPPVEVADHADAIGVRRPHGEVDAGRRADLEAMRSELVERAVMRPFAEQVQIEVGQHTPVPIRVVHHDNVVAGIGDAKTVIGRAAFHARFEHPGRIAPVHRDRPHGLAVRDEQEIDRARRRLEGADDDRAVLRVRTKDGKRIAMVAADQGRNRRVERSGIAGGGHALECTGAHGSMVAFFT
jgi:hypothetical protein